RRESRIGQVSEGQPFPFYHRAHRQPIAHEIYHWCQSSLPESLFTLWLLADDLQELLPKSRRRLHPPLFPSRNRDVRHPQPFRKLCLGQSPRQPLGTDRLRIISRHVCHINAV